MGLFDRKHDNFSDRDLQSFDSRTPDEKVNRNITGATNALLGEIRIIRWLLLVLLIIAVRAMFEFAGNDWWYTSGW